MPAELSGEALQTNGKAGIGEGQLADDLERRVLVRAALGIKRKGGLAQVTLGTQVEASDLQRVIGKVFAMQGHGAGRCAQKIGERAGCLDGRRGHLGPVEVERKLAHGPVDLGRLT